MLEVTRRTVLTSGAALCGLIAVLVLKFSGISDFDQPDVPTCDISFAQGGHLLEGTLFSASPNGPIVLLVHGDGAQDRTTDGGYLPLIHALTDARISVFSWDKPGVGASSGSWLDQAMQDRANEAVAAIAALRAQPGFDERPIGLIGFSQAGWVVPRVPALTNDAAFIVLIGAALSWQEQGAYYTAQRLYAEGQDAAFIEEALQAQRMLDQVSFARSARYEDYVEVERKAGTAEEALMSEARYVFVKRSFVEDVRSLQLKPELPVLVMSGSDDLNANAAQTVQFYKDALVGGNSHNRYKLVPGATHSLLVAKHYNYQLPSQWSRLAQARFLLSGRMAYAPQVLAELIGWITTVSAPPNRER